MASLDISETFYLFVDVSGDESSSGPYTLNYSYAAVAENVDTDDDGFYDDEDNCPLVKNGLYLTNQSDLDNDGLGDVCDDDLDGDGVNNDLDDYPYDGNGNGNGNGNGDGNGDGDEVWSVTHGDAIKFTELVSTPSSIYQPISIADSGTFRFNILSDNPDMNIVCGFVTVSYTHLTLPTNREV